MKKLKKNLEVITNIELRPLEETAGTVIAEVDPRIVRHWIITLNFIWNNDFLLSNNALRAKCSGDSNDEEEERPDSAEH